MASVASNLLNPKQAALNNKLNPSPLGFGSSSVSPTAYKTGSLSQTPAPDWGGIGNAIVGGAKATAGYLGGLGAQSSGIGSQPANVFGNTQAPVSPLGIGSQPPSKGLVQPNVSSGTYAKAPPAVKSVTTKSDGSQTTTYHPPQTDTQNKPDAQTYAITGANNFNANANLQTQGMNPGQAPDGTSAPQNPQNPQSPQQNQATYPGLVSLLANRSQQASPQYTEAYNQAQEYNRMLASSRTNQANAEADNRLNPIPIGDQTGREAVIRNQYLAQQNALASQFQGASTLVGAANTQQGLQQTGLTSAAGLAAPQLAGYNQQQFNPLTGQFGGGVNLNDAVSTIAQRVQSGQMSYDQAVSSLSGYGQGGVNALQSALGPNFNVAQSNALAGQQGTIGPAYSFAKTALQNVQEKMKSLGLLQGTNVPGANFVGNTFSGLTGIGSEATRAVSGAVAEARNAYSQLLAASQGGTPTQYGDQAKAAIPDNPTPNDIAAAIANLETLGQAKVGIYGNPGAVGSQTQVPTMNGGSLYSW